MSLKPLAENKCFGGLQAIYAHESAETRCTMRFGVFLPPQAASGRVPVLYWLSGLTCTEENFILKAGAQRLAAELGLAIVVPDTSPRGLDVPGEADSYDFGLGAGFYVDATEPPWSGGYRMYSYVTGELPRGRLGELSGRSGTHRDLRPFDGRTAGLPSPSRIPWPTAASRLSHRSVHRCAAPGARRRSAAISGFARRSGEQRPVSRHPAGAPALDLPAVSHPLELRMREGCDHSYFFVASFIEDHLRFHAR